MGLRQLYFLLGGLLNRLVYLDIGLAVILAFIGVKLILEALHGQGFTWAPEIGIVTSLAVIVVVLGVTTALSLLKVRRDPSAAKHSPAARPTAPAPPPGAPAPRPAERAPRPGEPARHPPGPARPDAAEHPPGRRGGSGEAPPPRRPSGGGPSRPIERGRPAPATRSDLPAEGR